MSGLLVGLILFVEQSIFEAELEIETDAVVAVCKRVGNGVPRHLKDIIKFDPNAVTLDIATARHEPDGIDKMVLDEEFAVGESVEGAGLPGVRAQRKFNTRSGAKTPLASRRVAVGVRDVSPLESRPVIEVDVR